MVISTSPMSWCTGSQLTKTSSAVISMPAIIWRTLVSRVAWVITTPLGSPVLPEVYWRRAGCSGWGAGRGAGARRRRRVGAAPAESDRRAGARRGASRSAAAASAGASAGTTTAAAPQAAARSATRSIPDSG